MIVDTEKVKEKTIRKRPPGTVPEAIENEMINNAMELARQQLKNGTASSQVITHFLKLGSTKQRLENDILQEQKKLVVAKTEQIQSAKKMEELYSKALKAMATYSGSIKDEDDV